MLVLAALLLHAQIDTLATAEMKKQKIPGLVVMVVENGKRTHEKAYGVANVETKEALTTGHLMRIGSTTKMMVAGCLVKLAQLGKLSLDEPIGKYLYQLPAPLKQLTANQLLSHTAGLMDRTLMYGSHDDDALAANVNNLQPDVLFTKPGEVHSYSNLGYAIAGRLIEVITGKAFADAMEDEIFKHIGMTRSTFRPTLAMTYPLSQGHELRNGGEANVVRPLADHAGYWPAGSAFSTGDDLAKLVAVITANPDMLAKPIVTTISGSTYGYGIAKESVNGQTIIGHSGARRGYATNIMTLPDKKLGVVVMSNLEGVNLGPLTRKILESVSSLDLTPKPQPHTNINPTGITGTYTQYTTLMSIENTSGKLTLTQDSKTTELQPAPGPCFAGNKTTICFTLDATGKAKYAHLGSRALLRRN